MDQSRDSLRSQTLDQVMRAIGLNRRPGFHFAGNLLGLSSEKTESGVRLTLEPRPHYTDESGEVDLTCFGMYADLAIGMGIRAVLSYSGRMATASLNLGLTGAPRLAPLVATTRFLGFVQGIAGEHALAQTEIVGPGGVVAYATGTFVVVAAQPLAPITLGGEAPPLVRTDLDAPELKLLARAERALDRVAAEGGAFITRFLDLAAARTDNGAVMNVENGLHFANRVGHFQGGMQIGVALSTAQAALDPGWLATSINVCYLRPGEGEAFHAAAQIVHRGRTTAVITTRIGDGAGRAVLQATSTHAARQT